MKCDRFEERLQEALDDRRSPGLDRELKRHAEQCAACRELLAAASQMVTAFASEPQIGGGAVRPASQGGRQVVRGQVAAGQVAAVQSRWRHWTAVGSAVVAASLLFVILVSARTDDRSGGEVGYASSSERTVGRERIGRRGGEVLGIGMLPASSKAASPRVATQTSAPAAPNAILPGVGGFERREGREGMEWTDLASDSDEALAEWMTAIGGSISTIRETKMEGVPDVTERFRPLARSVHSVMEALKGTWRGARGERSEREPETSWVAEDSWIA